MCVGVCGFCNVCVWVCVCVCVCVGVVMYVFVFVCVCVWILKCVVVLLLCTSIYTLFVLFPLRIFIICFSLLLKVYCHRVTTELQ